MEKIAIGCENEKHICILDSVETLDTCYESTVEGGKCNTVILEKLPLPMNEEDIYIYNTSWSQNGMHIAVDGKFAKSKKFFTILLSLENEDEWKMLIESSGSIHSQLSPTENKLAISEVYIITLSDGFLEKPTTGGSPVWSGDGSKLAYLTNTLTQNPQLMGIAEYDLIRKNSKLLYQPIILGEDYSPRINLRIGDDSGELPTLSWSPDNRYIAFVARYRNDYDSQIFSLDTATGDVTALTTRFEAKEGQQCYYAPAWGS